MKSLITLAVSIIIAISIGEVFLRAVFPNTPTFGSYLPRYTIDSHPSYVSGLTRRDTLLPFSTAPNYSHMLTDMAYHPKPYRITLDDYGYRNRDAYTHYDNVIVGDSVAFGSGVDDGQTVSAILGRNSNVYNLAISGAGPAMYMAMIDSFLERGATDRFTILFFLGNDIRNLNGAYWDELADCLPPKDSRISRKDVSASPESPPIILSLPVLRSSYLAHFICMAVVKHTGTNGKTEEDDISALHAMAARKAIADLRNHINRDTIIESARPKTIGLLNELMESRCTDNGMRSAIGGVIDDVRDGDVRGIAGKTYSIVKHFIDAGCYPIGREMQNLASYTNYHAGFFYESTDALDSGYSGNIYNYISLLKMAAGKYSDLEAEIDDLTGALLEMKDMRVIEGLSSNIQRRLDRKDGTPATSVNSPGNGCDKLEIFLEYLADLQRNDIAVSIYLIPAEYHLRRYSTHPPAAHKITVRAAKKGINCTDLTTHFIKHYENKENNALFLDGAHFTVEGNERVAEWIGK